MWRKEQHCIITIEKHLAEELLENLGPRRHHDILGTDFDAELFLIINRDRFAERGQPR